MSSGNAHQERLNEELDAAIQENAPSGKLEDVEIQRLVELSNDASYQRTERVPVKTVEAFEPRSLVSIAMAAQRRRESELRTAVPAGAAIDEDGAVSPDATIGPDVEAASNVDQLVADDAATPEVSADTASAVEMAGEGEASEEGIQRRCRPPRHRSILRQAAQKGLRKGGVSALMKARPGAWKRAGRQAAPKPRRSLSAPSKPSSLPSARIAELTEVDSGALAASINETILRLASERAGRAIAEQPDSFADRIESLLATIRTASGQPSIRLNPSDLASIQPLAETERNFAIVILSLTRPWPMGICR